MAPPLEDGKSQADSAISVVINGTQYQVPRSFSAVTLNEYLRNHLHLTGTKILCGEGGCGVCMVHAVYPDPSGSGKTFRRNLNSCLCPILACDGYEITTVEGLGDQKHPHPIQQRLTDHYGTQCGYCTPGWIMSMYSLTQEHTDGALTKNLVEESLDGNICRCTGYRPILDAFKSFAKDEFKEPDGLGIDLEDLGTAVCNKTGKKCAGSCGNNGIICVKPLPTVIADNAPPWFQPASLDELFQLRKDLQEKNPYFLVGHTGVGVYNDGPYHAFVDMRHVKELFVIDTNSEKLTIGAGLALTDVINLFQLEAARTPGFAYLKQLAAMISKTAHVGVRNVGSIGGNLAMKNRHQEFPSDSFTCLAVADARIIVGPEERSYSTTEFLDVDMKDKLILRIELQPFSSENFFKTFKVMIRAQNSHGYVNAGFRVELDKSKTGALVVTGSAIVLANIHPKFVHASKTEAFLLGKDLANVKDMQAALAVLNDEVNPEAKDDEASPAYRKNLCVTLFYRFILEIVGDGAEGRYHSGVTGIVRPLSSGSQSFETMEKNWPLTKPMPKLESLQQCTGEAKYISDIDEFGMLHAVFATSTEGNASIFKIDPTDALAVPGVLKVFTADHIPGNNVISSPSEEPEELLASSRVVYHGQPLAIIVGVTRAAAEEGARLVKVEYRDVQPVVLTAKDAMREKSFFDQKPDQVEAGGDADKAIEGAARKVSGELELGGQVHFHMETQTSVVRPTEDGLDIEAGTQWIDHAQTAVSRSCGIPKNAINVSVKRVGGGFGAKVTRSSIITCGTAVAAFLTRRSVKMHMSLVDNLKTIGKRYPYFTKYEAGFDDSGKLLGIKMEIYCNLGSQKNDSPIGHSKSFVENAYKCPAWKLTYYACKTNLPPNTYCRGPGSTESVYFVETLMEHVAASLGKTPIDIKQQNFFKDGDKTMDGSRLSDVRLPQVTEQLLKDADVTNRLESVKDFNKANRWLKRGLAVVPLRYPCTPTFFTYGCLVAVYHTGGYVSVTHGGIEIGQGINTKVAQVVAHELEIDMKYIRIQPTQGITNANAFATGGSITSELACQAAMDCCKELKGRIDPVKKSVGCKTWEETIETCYGMGVDLSARAWVAPKPAQKSIYNTYACTATEVELNVLTGEYQVNRMDVLYDVGESMSPLIDIGQVEGALVMGLGYYTTEELLYSKTNGENLAPGTWKYKPPMSKDIPVDLRVKFLKNSPNPSGILRSKLVAEPPLNMSCSVVFALRDAIKASRAENEKHATNAPTWIEIVAPLTVERAQQLCKLDLSLLRYRD
ncbi:Xanthine dehydrogenase [Hypsibius exemplaris]|uniref:Xanthine dehydrogenase n=1 Tax=Hypsibius exemplaris TaxID=2072580 RepID=A0A1W0WTX4_HYPEX|nr:Xanthine dehydrogenase [Hypsibius exemplaris]